MLKADFKIRVRYAETDKMGYVYYGNYATYFEVARVEMLRNIGLSYKELEDSGILLPVANFQVKYILPAYYDDLLTIRTYIKTKPGVRLVFEYETLNEKNELLNTAIVTLVFISAKTGKPIQSPEYFMNILLEKGSFS
jgi:acyl-CoA thioester hydrolase